MTYMLEKVGKARSTFRIGQMPNSNVQRARSLVGLCVRNKEAR